MAARLTWHDEVFNDQVLSAPWMVALMAARASAGAEYAQSVAPVDHQGEHPGRFKESIHAESGIREPSGRRTRRAVGRVVSDDPAAMYIEFGTKTTPAHRTLGRALDVMGS